MAATPGAPPAPAALCVAHIGPWGPGAGHCDLPVSEPLLFISQPLLGVPLPLICASDKHFGGSLKVLRRGRPCAGRSPEPLLRAEGPRKDVCRPSRIFLCFLAGWIPTGSSTVGSALVNEPFTGNAVLAPRCSLTSAAGTEAWKCPQAASQGMKVGGHQARGDL